MVVRPVLRLPEPVLKRRAEPVLRVDDAARALALDLVDTMRASPACVGLAAPQIGVSLRAFVIDVSGHRKARSCHGEVVLLDPEVLVAQDPVHGREGCMSVPDLTGEVARATTLVVRGLTLEGEERVLRVDAFEARAVQHEIDHLDGLLFLDRVSSADAVFRRKVYRQERRLRE
ncbi:MAG: peptide deformylase [Actinomycetota bacterium]|nr:peptide deformylase [Actinomycetota bacterium]PLS75363.1 MAG: peptide deformylase [Actinomycetota bacterium]